MQPASDFRDISLPGYRNINELVALDDQLHICETLFGDKNAEIMVLAQDAANFDTMRTWFTRHGRKGICHNDRLKTNCHLVEAFTPYLIAKGQDWSSRDCGIFYANAIWLLKDSKSMSSALPSVAEATERSLPVLRATVEGLPRLKLIVAVGKEAYQTLCLLDASLAKNWAAVVADGKVQHGCVFGVDVLIGTVNHMGYWGSQARVNRHKADSGQTAEAATLFREDVGNILQASGLLAADTAEV